MDIKVVEETMGANYDRLFITRGPRTKRPRPSSFTSSSSIGGSSTGAHGEGEAEVHVVGHDHGYDGSSSSVAVSTIEFFKNTDEEEDMANCLILLAQGNKNNEQRQNRRKTTPETVTETREGLSVFECKTCDRNFGSFQALGGHRASHRKPKAMINEEKKVVHHPAQFNISETSSPKLGFPSDPCTGNKVVYMNNNKSKVHECSICGADFSSGQALGGHMRRHRNTIPVAMNKLESSSENLRRNVFSLDLNLPAPEEDLEVPENNNFSRLPQPLIFSAAPALVDCHY